MMKWLLWLLGGILLGGIVHLATVLWLPRTATQDAYSRLTPVTPVNGVTTLPAPSPEKTLLPYMDPAFATAVCRYDLAQARCSSRSMSARPIPRCRSIPASAAPITPSTTAPPAAA